MYDNLINTIKTINKSKKIRCFFFGSTVKKETSNFYISSIRENQKFIYGGAIIYSESSGKKIAKIPKGIKLEVATILGNTAGSIAGIILGIVAGITTLGITTLGITVGITIF